MMSLCFNKAHAEDPIFAITVYTLIFASIINIYYDQLTSIIVIFYSCFCSVTVPTCYFFLILYAWLSRWIRHEDSYSSFAKRMIYFHKLARAPSF